MVRASVGGLVLGLALAGPIEAKVVLFHEAGFPSVESEAPSRETLAEALQGKDVTYVGVEDLKKPEALSADDLLVLPYGSAFPADAWPAIRSHLESGGNLLNLGGRPLWFPVFREAETATGSEASERVAAAPGRFRVGRPQDTYWRLLAAVQAAEVPARAFGRFAWDQAFPFRTAEIRARRVFWINTLFVANYAPPAGQWRGLGFFHDKDGHRVAAPVTRLDFTLTPRERRPQGHGRFVMLSFEPEPGYWASEAGRSLIREAAEHAALGPAFVWVELPRIVVGASETATAVLHARDRASRSGPVETGEVRVELRREGQVLETQKVPHRTEALSASLVFASATTPGFYQVRATYERAGAAVDVHETGFWRRDEALLRSGPALAAGRTYLRREGKPFLAVGVNAWVNDSVFPFFPENGNALEWERDFQEMAARGFNFVRTGIWFDRLRLTDTPTGAARESVLRNLEAMLHSAGRHGLHVQFTFFSFEPHTVFRGEAPVFGPGRNPYTDPVALEAQQTFVRSVAARFPHVPFLSWDLINEPSFSNPRAIFRGNQPNADATETRAWQEWLEKRYASPRALAEAWGTIPEDLPAFGSASLPAPADLTLTRNGNPRQVRAVDYNLFAQDMFSRWAGEMVKTIRGTGSRQPVAVGQDEGGVTNRLLNHFYGGSGVNMTSLHNWWHDDALLWGALAAKRPGLPNLLGETGPQPSVAMDGETRWDETKGLGLMERKLALGLAAGNAGSVVWIWSRTDPFHVGRPDGSSTLWVEALTRLGTFARDAEPHLSDARASDVAIVLPQSLQLSVFNDLAVEAQQKCVRALYHHARASAETVGEYQIDLLGSPRLVLLPSPWTLRQETWDALLSRVRAGATLLVTGRFDLDEHFRPTNRHEKAGIAYDPGILPTRENLVRWPGGSGLATFSGSKTTYLEQATLPGGATFARKALGQGRVLFFTLPLELADDPKLLGSVYRWALAEARVAPAYRTALDDPGILICPTALDAATLYVLTSESSVRREVAFRDVASGKDLRVPLDPGRAAILLVTHAGQVVARYDPASVELGAP
jgi:hypothetical protein